LARNLAVYHLPNVRHIVGPAVGIIDGLVGKGLLNGEFRSRVAKVARARNDFVHGASVPTDRQLRPLISELDELLAALRTVGT